MKNFILYFLFFCVNILHAQTSVFTAKEIFNLFKKSKADINWAFPMGENKNEPLIWNERKTSFSKEIKTFVAYKNDHLKASLSVSKDRISGTLFLEDNQEISLSTNENGFLTVSSASTKHTHCGVCHHNHCNENISLRTSTEIKTPELQALSVEDKKALSDDVLRIYRLALPVSYDYFSTKFNHSVQEVKNFWAETEMGLNEIYMRDLSIKFVVVNDERLIIKTQNDPINKPEYQKDAEKIIRNSTENINTLISQNDYDIGLVIAKNNRFNEIGDSYFGLLGLAGVGAGYLHNFKANAIAVTSLTAIAHEIGHLFGAKHTQKDTAENSLRSEPGEGQSIMSYGFPMDFFSMPNIIQNIKPFLSRMPYFSDQKRQNLVGNHFSATINNQNFWLNNPSYGIKTQNLAPILDENSLKRNYKIPKNTFFQFKIKAKDPEGKPLSYFAHQADINNYVSGSFISKKKSLNPEIKFQTEFAFGQRPSTEENEFYQEKTHTKSEKTGIFSFWIGASDADTSAEKIQNNQSTTYLAEKVSVEIVDAQPFIITNSFKESYKSGEPIHLTWQVDHSVFSRNNQVRILLSDDFGKTFKHTILESTENDGEQTIRLPYHLTIGTTLFQDENKDIEAQIPAGVIKIEVIDHIAYALSEIRPFSLKSDGRFKIIGGFKIEKPEISFEVFPSEKIKISCEKTEDLPEIVTQANACPNQTLHLEFWEEGKTMGCERFTFKRHWKFTDQCGNSATFVQEVSVIPDYQPLRFSDNIPSEITITCQENAPEYALTIQGGCPPYKINASEERIIVHCDENQQFEKSWTITDACGETFSTTQIVNITPEIVIYNAVSTQDLSQNILKITRLSKENEAEIIIFNELGQKVFQSGDYHLYENYFKGKGNLGSLKNKKLVIGTYFYLLSYTENNQRKHKKGYLFVK